jgi:hypothetical protein
MDGTASKTRPRASQIRLLTTRDVKSPGDPRSNFAAGGMGPLRNYFEVRNECAATVQEDSLCSCTRWLYREIESSYAAKLLGQKPQLLTSRFFLISWWRYFAPLLRGHVAVTRVTLYCRGFIKCDWISSNHLHQSVTLVTFHFCMATLQRQLRSLVMVKRRGYPSLHIMAPLTRRLPCVISKLSSVWLNVARLAFLRCSLELNDLLARGSLMTRATSHRSVSANQRKTGL